LTDGSICDVGVDSAGTVKAGLLEDEPGGTGLPLETLLGRAIAGLTSSAAKAMEANLVRFIFPSPGRFRPGR
jgi:hypothetical protein